MALREDYGDVEFEPALMKKSELVELVRHYFNHRENFEDFDTSDIGFMPAFGKALVSPDLKRQYVFYFTGPILILKAGKIK